MIKRKCQICHTEYPLEEYYTKDVYICKKCNTIIANFSRFKKIIKSKGTTFGYKLIMNERLILDAKEDILRGGGINSSIRKIIGGLK